MKTDNAEKFTQTMWKTESSSATCMAQETKAFEHFKAIVTNKLLYTVEDANLLSENHCPSGATLTLFFDL